MAETVVVRQNSEFETEFLAVDPQAPESIPQPVTHLHSVTPYGMMLTSLGACTTLVLHTYAQNQGLALEMVEIRLQYRRVFIEDCEECETIDRYDEEILEEIALSGDLSEHEREKLFRIAHHCPIYKMYRDGITVRSTLAGTNG